MPLPRWLGRANRVGLNRVTRLFAGRMPGMGIVVHQGRCSGRRYRTPVNVFRRDGGFVVCLTYGPEADWVRNVLQTGRAELRTRGRTYPVTNPELIQDSERRPVPKWVRPALRLVNTDHFVMLDVDETVR